MYMGFGPLNPDWVDGPAATRLRPSDMNILEGSVGAERVLDGYAHCGCCGIISGNGCGGYVCVKIGLTVCEFTSGSSSLPSSNIREKSSSSHEAGVDVASDCSESS